jgi:hypothetical protein
MLPANVRKMLTILGLLALGVLLALPQWRNERYACRGCPSHREVARLTVLGRDLTTPTQTVTELEVPAGHEHHWVLSSWRSQWVVYGPP